MKTKKYIKRIFSFVLATILLFSAIPVSLAVQDMLVEEVDAKIVREVTELREESVKHFLCEDGSYIAATYSTPVHYKENGEWKEIDNSLSLDRTTLSESGKPTYTTKAGGLDVSIPQDFSDEQKITAKNKGYEISFGLNANQDNVSLKKSASIVDVEALSSNTEVKNIAIEQSTKVLTAKKLSTADVVEKHNEEMMAADNQSSAVTFNNVFPNTDLEYIVSSSSIKENIVVYEPQNEYTYSFNMNFEGLIPVTHTDGSISLVEPSNPDTFVFWIEAPYMYDANNEESIDIEMTLTENGDEYLLTLVASEEWINNENRVFPVVIDPTIYLSDSSISDVFVIDGIYANSTRVKNELRVGRNLTNVTRTYINPTLPSIPYGSKVSSAYLKLYQDYYYQALGANDISIRVYDCYKVATWKSHEISWNNQPFNNSNNGYQSTTGAVLLSSKSASSSASSYTFDITDAAQRWVNGGINNGLMLASSNENTKTQIDFHSSRVSDAANHPDIWITYTVPGITQTSWNTNEDASTSVAIGVVSGKSWTILSSQDWLTATKTTDSSFKISVTRNNRSYERTGSVSVYIDDRIIGTVTVVQAGSDTSLLVDTDNWVVDCNDATKTISITSNTDWIVESSDPSWLSSSVTEGYDNDEITITVANNDVPGSVDIGEAGRKGTITISPKDGNMEKSKIIEVTQLDTISNYFSVINSAGIREDKSSTYYNHSLATWAMNLSYHAYNYPDGTDLPSIPGDYMDDSVNKSAKQLLTDYGFKNVTDYNYEVDNSGAHIIAHRNIAVADEGNVTEGVMRPVVVVVVRGSVTTEDWDDNFTTQFNPKNNRFVALSNEVETNLSNYISSHISQTYSEEPIILVTGHSLGAAVANLLAAKLNTSYETSDIYAYTFGTPNVINERQGTEAINYPNIFNILNSNDVVTYVPFTFTIPVLNYWERYGIDLTINMPYTDEQFTEPLGVFSHMMGTYMDWMEDHPNLSFDEISELSSEAIVRGILPNFVIVKCPVEVSIKDSEGNLIAFESQEETSTYSEITNTGVVSWITDDGAKVFFIPNYADAADIEIRAYDYGTMDLMIETAGDYITDDKKAFNDVGLYPGKEFLVEVSEDIPTENTQLFVTENGEIVGEVTETAPHLKGVTVNHVEKTDRVVTYLSFVTDNTVSEIRFYNRTTGGTYYLYRDGTYATIVENEDGSLTWTAGYVYIRTGDFVYDVYVESDGELYTYDNVFTVHIPQEYIDLKNGTLETNSIQMFSNNSNVEIAYYEQL